MFYDKWGFIARRKSRMRMRDRRTRERKRERGDEKKSPLRVNECEWVRIIVAPSDISVIVNFARDVIRHGVYLYFHLAYMPSITAIPEVYAIPYAVWLWALLRPERFYPRDFASFSRQVLKSSWLRYVEWNKIRYRSMWNVTPSLGKKI